MSLLRSVFAVLSLVIAALVSQAAAQCSAATTTIHNAADASTIAKCSTFSGSIALASGTTDNVALDGIQKIQGSFIANNVTQVTTISSNSLNTITDTLTLNGLTSLSTFNFSALASVDTLMLEALPAAQTLSFLQTLQNINTISIQNTQISQLQGFNMPTVANVTITDNPYMVLINLQPYNITKSLTIGQNGQSLAVSLPNAQLGYNMTFSNCSTISIPSVTYINSSLGLYNNEITSFNGAPQLRSVGGALGFVGNQYMANISLPELQTIDGSFLVTGNPNLTLINEFYSLQKVGGGLNMTGNFTGGVSFPALQDVLGSFLINSTTSSSCSTLSSLSGGNNVIKGNYQCVSDGLASNSSNSPASTNSVGSSASAASNQNALSGGAKAGIGVGVGVGGTTLLLAGLSFFWRRRKQQKLTSSSDHIDEKDGNEIDSAAMVDGTPRHEMEVPNAELPSGNEPHELPAKHGVTELGRTASTNATPGIESRHEMPANETPPQAKEDQQSNE